MSRQEAIGILLTVCGGALGLLWGSGRLSHPFIPALALLLFLAGGTFFSKTSSFAATLSPLVGKTVQVRAWGAELPGDAGSGFKVEKVLALGPGLHFYLRPLPDGLSTHLKIAQPLKATMDESGCVIVEAKYIQWAGRKIRKNTDEKALLIKL